MEERERCYSFILSRTLHENDMYIYYITAIRCGIEPGPAAGQVYAAEDQPEQWQAETGELQNGGREECVQKHYNTICGTTG
jgi:hypothetical protein